MARPRPTLWLVAAVLVTACGKPPDLEQPRIRPSTTMSPSPSVRPTEATPAPVPTGWPPTGWPPTGWPPTGWPPTGWPSTAGPSSTGFGESTAVPCDGRPDADDVLTVLRRADLGGAGARVTTGPMCAGTWQWTVVRVPEADPLQVVTRGPADALRLVTAGTDVCTVDVQSNAPAGIRAAACDARPPGR